MKHKKLLIGVVALVLVCAIVLIAVLSCSSSGKPVMTLEKDGIKVTLSVNLYELMLTRMKGVLYVSGFTHNGLDPTSPLFWDYQDTFDGKTFQSIDDYYCDLVLENCRTYIAVLYLFEKHVGKLSDADEAAIDKLMDELVLTDGGGSKTKLNAVLEPYGVNYDILRDAYELDFKMAAVKKALYGENASMVGANLKNAYLEDNYVHFRQIFLSTENIVYKTDEFGDDIYYYPSTHEKKGHIYYDTDNGERAKNDDGTDKLDKYGDVIYYVKGTDGKKIAYNTTYGEREMMWDGSEVRTEPMTAEELEAVAKLKDEFYNELKDKDFAEFEAKELAYLRETEPNAQFDPYDDGIYLRKDLNLTGDYAYTTEIAKQLSAASVGDVIVVQSPTGWHIIKKYAHTQNAYEKEGNEGYFGDFNDKIMEKLLLEECQALYPYIEIHEKVLESAPKMKDVAINGIYAYY